MSQTMTATIAPPVVQTFRLEFLFNDTTKYTKREELSATCGLPREQAKIFAVADLMGLAGKTEEEALLIYDTLMHEVDETAALYVEKGFPDGSTFSITVEVPEFTIAD